MKIIRESLEFKRGLDPSRSLEIGKYSKAAQEEQRREFLMQLLSLGITGSWREVVSKERPTTGWKFNLENSLSSKSERNRMNISDDIMIHYFVDLDGWKESLILPEDFEGGPFIFVTFDNVYDPKEAFGMKTPDEAVKKLLELEYEESNDWDYLKIMKKIIGILGV